MKRLQTDAPMGTQLEECFECGHDLRTPPPPPMRNLCPQQCVFSAGQEYHACECCGHDASIWCDCLTAQCEQCQQTLMMRDPLGGHSIIPLERPEGWGSAPQIIPRTTAPFRKPPYPALIRFMNGPDQQELVIVGEGQEWFLRKYAGMCERTAHIWRRMVHRMVHRIVSDNAPGRAPPIMKTNAKSHHPAGGTPGTFANPRPSDPHHLWQWVVTHC